MCKGRVRVRVRQSRLYTVRAYTKGGRDGNNIGLLRLRLGVGLGVRWFGLGFGLGLGIRVRY